MSNTLVKTFPYSGGTQRFVMPDGFLPQVDVYMWGGAGGGGGDDGNGPGGNGAAGYYLATTLDINPNDVVIVATGGGGDRGYSSGGGGGGTSGQSFTQTIFNSRNPPAGQSAVYYQSNGAYCSFLNTYGVWEANGQAASFDRTYTVNFPLSGYYFIEASCDNYGYVFIDGVQVLYTPDFHYSSTAYVYVSAGNHSVRTYGINTGGPASMATFISTATLSGGYGGAAGPAGWSGGGGGGGGASLIIVNGTIAACAAGGGGGGGGSNNRAGYSADGDVLDSYNKNGQNCYGDGGGGGGGGGGLISGQGGAPGYDNAYGGSPGKSGSSTDGAQRGNGMSPAGSNNGFWQSPVAIGGASDTPGANGQVVLVFHSMATGQIREGGRWRDLASASIKINGAWRSIVGSWVKVNGQWRQLNTSSPRSISTDFSTANFGR